MSDVTSGVWWRLLRAGNVFTAISNIVAGYLLVRGEWGPILPLMFLILASASLYLAGMVLNDVFDLEVDRTERPERPLPSGQIDPQFAKIVGFGLLIDGLSAAGVASWLLESWLPIAVAILLTLTIVAYDAWLKNTKLGPLAMGACRALNILLGASAVSDSGDMAPAFIFAAAIGIYTLGLTLLARDEAGESKLVEIKKAATISQLGILAILLLPTLITVPKFGWFAFWFACLMMVRVQFLKAIEHPEAKSVQSSVSRLITTFIPLDSLACIAAVGWGAGLPVLALLMPTFIATRRAPMT